MHVDAYRLGGAAELDDLDLDAELEDVVTLVEWGRGMAESLSADGYILVDIDRETVGDGEGRVVRLAARGERWDGVVEEGSE